MNGYICNLWIVKFGYVAICRNCFYDKFFKKKFTRYQSRNVVETSLLGAAYKGKEPSNKHKYMSGFKTRECMVDSSDVYHNLHVDHELEKLPDLPKPPLLKVRIRFVHLKICKLWRPLH